MAKRLLAMLLTLVMILQPVLPAAAEGAGENAEPAEETVEVAEEVTEETVEETTEAPSETVPEETAEGPEQTSEPTEVTEVTEITEPETTGPENGTYAMVRLICSVDGMTFQVYPSATAEDPESEEILPQEDGSYWLAPGEYAYVPFLDGEAQGEPQTFHVSDEPEQAIQIVILHDEDSEGVTFDTVDAICGSVAAYASSDSDSVVAAYGQCGDHMKWYYYESGRLLIQGYGMMWNYSARGNKSSAPWYVMQDSHNYMIRRIQFSSTNGTIGITSIGNYAFRCIQSGKQDYQSISAKFNIKFPSTLRRIGENAFEGFKYWLQWASDGSPVWSSSEALILPDSLTVIAESAFQDAAIGTVELPQSLQEIDDNAFRGCRNADIVLPKYLGEIGSYAFYGCNKVTYKPAGSLYYVASSAFESSGLTELPDLSYFPYIPAYAFRNTKIRTATIPASIQTISKSAFAGCSNLKEITIPVEVTSIEENAFSSCTNLQTVHYTGTTADWNAISIASGNSALTNAVLDIPNNYRILYQFVDGADNPNPKYADKDTTLTLKAASKTGYVFAGWYKEDTFKTKVSTVPAGNKEDITLYAKWTPVTYSVKFDANGGTGSIAQKSAKYDEPFDIPSTGVSRSRYQLAGWNTASDGTGTAFAAGQSVTNLCNTQGASITLYAQWILDMGNITWTLDASGKLTVSGSGPIPDFANVSEVPWDPANVRSVSLGTEITRIGSYAFADCVNLTSITIPDNIQGIGSSAFRGCTSLEGVTLPEGITEIEAETFRDCTSFVYADLPASVKAIRKNAFYNCPALEVVNYAGNLKQLGAVSIAEGNQNGLADVISYKTLYDAGEIYIEDWGKISGTYGKNITWKLSFDGTLTLSGTGDMTDDWYSSGDDTWVTNDLERVVIGEGITSVGKGAFLQGTHLTAVTIPQSVKVIKEKAFSGCSALATVRYSGKQEQWDAISVASGNEALAGAKLLLSTYLITYKNADGAENPNPDTADKDKSLTLKDAAKTGYLFDGWYKEDSFKTKVTSIPAGNEADITLYAKWTPIRYSVSFDANGGTGSIAQMPFSYDVSAALPSAGVSRTGYTLRGWNTAKDGSGTAYTPGQSVRNLSSTQGSTLTLYAQWQPITYRVVYDANGGEGNPEGQQVHYGETFRLPGADSVTRELYSLAGWAVSGETKVYQPGEDVKDLAAEEGATVTLLAQWSPNFGEIGELTWGMYNDGTLIIVGTGKMPDFSSQNAAPWAKASVTGVAIGEGVTYIGKHAFSGCTNLTTVAFSTTVEGIGESAFSGCVNLTSADTYESIQAIGKDAFRGCTSLRRIVLPDTLQCIGKGAFQGCTSLIAYYYLGSLAQWGQVTYDPAEDPVDAGYVLYWGSSGEFAYMNGYCGASSRWRLLPDGTLRISGTGDATAPLDTTKTPWWSVSDVTSAIVEEGIARIGGDLFQDCAAMTTITLPRSLTVIGADTFAGCTGLKTVRYAGKQEQWDAITIYTGNEALTNATLLLSTYMITYVNTEGAENPNPVTADKEQALVLQNPKRTGYSFDGWYLDDGFRTRVTSIPAGNEDDVTLYAKWVTRVYFIEFHSNSGSGKMDDQAVWYDAAAFLSKNKFTRKGYTFAGWSLTPGEGAASFQDEEQVLNLGDGDSVFVVNLYAQWTPIEYSLTLDANGGTGAPEKVTLRYGTPYTLPTAQEVRKDGFALTGWTGKIGSSKKTYKPGAELMDLTTVEGTEVTLTAQWGPCKYTVRFEPGAGTGKAKTQAMTYGKAAALTANSFKLPGYTFDGWLAEDGTAYSNKESVMNLTAEPDSVVVLTAQWRPVAYRIVFDVNGGTGEVPGSGGYYTCGVTYTVPESNLTRQGYRFMGWSAKKNGSVIYKEGDTLKDLATTEGKAVTLHAVWQAEHYHLRFEANGGTGSAAPMYDLTSGKAVSLRANSFRKPGYKFTGWNTEPDGSGTAYKDKAKVTLNADGGTVVLYAQWEQIHYTVTYKNVPVGSEGGNPGTYTIEEGLQLKDAFIRGMTFEGWYLDAKFKTPFDGIAPGGDARNVTVYAKLSGYSDIFFVDYYGNGADNDDGYITDGIGSKTLYYSKAYTLRANTFKRAGYKFLGWSQDASAKVPEYKDKQTVSNLQPDPGKTFNNVSLYAVWEPIQYTVTYKGVTADEIQAANNVTSFNVLDSVNLQVPARPGCTFLGWYTESNFQTYIYGIIGIYNMKNLTLYAKWTGSPVKYAIAYNGNGAASVSMKVQNTACGKEVALTNNAFKRPGYTFLGWSTDPNAAEPEFTNKQKVSNLSSTGETVTLYAVWEAIPYTVTLKNIGGAAVSGAQNGILTYTAVGRDLPIPVLPGAKFAGWYTTADFKDGTQLKELKAGTTGNKVLYAKWQIQ